MNMRLLSIGLTPSDDDGDVGEKHEDSSQAQSMGRMATHYDRLPDSQHSQVQKVLFASARVDTFWKLESRHCARFANECGPPSRRRSYPSYETLYRALLQDPTNEGSIISLIGSPPNMKPRTAFVSSVVG
ncbi:hypothetical protein NLI96_g4773 [Meripilus lineatus]|uniref:Uncharacterized protein n=1 Tax=Meripilus lineatus TaxID=2056292 RepID=A0AAD5V428_9APHY|nr:hypothetical protein NLI96_g4773 [Physisporinus lineatus]